MKTQSLCSRAIAFAAGLVMLAVSAAASADPPSRVVRLGYTTGAVSFSPAGEDDWVQATINRPMTIGDRLWVDSGARAELQVGGAILRLNAGTSVTVLNLDDNIAQLQLTQGTMNVHVRRFDPGQVLEVDTPNLAFTVRQSGDYRIAVDTEGNATDLIVRKGQGEVYGEGASYVVDSRQPYRFTGTGLREYEPFAAPGIDDFDRWALDRDRSYDNSVSARYVSPDVVGYQDLDANGTWGADPTYGNVWFPNRVAAGWAPYRDGHWAWVDPWGWTWIDDAPWGFAVSHYGRWSHVGGRWGWVPGPARSRAYYAPALVAFVGGNNFQLSISTGNVGGIGWFPLGPREIYRPAYAVSRGYFERVNVTNTVVNTTVINNYYNNTNVNNVTYVNRQVPGAVVAVPTTAFVQSQQVARSAVRVTPQMMAAAPVATAAAVAPTERSVRGAAAQGDKPPARVFERQVVARTAPAPAQASFAAQQQQLQTRQGKPLDDTARKQIQATPAVAAPAVRVVAQPQAAPPTATLPAGLTGQDPRTRAAPANAGAPAPAQGAAQGTAPGQVAQPGAAPQPAAGANADRGKGQQRGRQPDGASTQAATPPPAPPAQTRLATPAPSAQPAQPQVAAQPPMAAPGAADDGAKGQQRGKGGERRPPPDAVPVAPPPQMAAPGLQPHVSSPSQTRMQAQEQQQARQAQAAQQQARQAEQAQQQQTRQAEQQQARQAQAAQQQARQAEQQQARQAQAAQQQAAQQQARQAQVEQQQARQAQAAQQQAAQQQARQAQAAQQQAQQQQARQPQAAQQAQQRVAPPAQGANNKKDADEQKREEEARKQKG